MFQLYKRLELLIELDNKIQLGKLLLRFKGSMSRLGNQYTMMDLLLQEEDLFFQVNIEQEQLLQQHNIDLLDKDRLDY